jgi:AbrB family looped-hinge helix DNA binding protein
MRRTIPIDAAGRLVLPKAIRDRLHLNAGSRLEVELDGDSVRLRPSAEGAGVVVSKDGRLLISTGADEFDAVAAVRADREGRDEKLAGVIGGS